MLDRPVRQLDGALDATGARLAERAARIAAIRREGMHVGVGQRLVERECLGVRAPPVELVRTLIDEPRLEARTLGRIDLRTQMSFGAIEMGADVAA
jgi:hypothetical protein